MIWNVTIFAVHVAALVFLATLWRSPPDWIQKLVIGLLIASAAIFVGAALCELAGVWWHWMVKRVAYAGEHVAVLVYVFRLWYIQHICPTFSKHSHSSQR